MTNEHNLKIGDKVTTTKYYDIDVNGYCTTIPIGEEGVIDDIFDDELFVCFNRYGLNLTLSISDVEPIPPLDRRKAFLTELQTLLRKYNAFLIAHITDIPVSAYFNDKEDDVPFASIGKEINKGCGVIVNSDNIIDFNKE